MSFVITILAHGLLLTNNIRRMDGSMFRESRAGDDDDILSSMQNTMWQGKPALLSVYRTRLNIPSADMMFEAAEEDGDP